MHSITKMITKIAQIIIAVEEIAAGDDRVPGVEVPEFSTVTSKRWIPFEVMWVSSTLALSVAETAEREAERPMMFVFVRG